MFYLYLNILVSVQKMFSSQKLIYPQYICSLERKQAVNFTFSNFITVFIEKNTVHSVHSTILMTAKPHASSDLK